MPTAPFLAVDLQRRNEKTSVAFARRPDKGVRYQHEAGIFPNVRQQQRRFLNVIILSACEVDADIIRTFPRVSIIAPVPKVATDHLNRFVKKRLRFFLCELFFRKFEPRVACIIGKRIGPKSSGFGSVFPKGHRKIATFLNFEFCVEIRILRQE